MSPGPGLHARLSVTRPTGFALDVELSIAPGETVALLGPNGAGKSTLVAAIAGLLPIESGRIALDGVSLDDPSAGVFVAAEDRRIGVVFQDYLLFPHLDVLENISFGLTSRGISSAEASERARRWLAGVGLSDMAKQKPEELSGGQAQRVALARALVTDPALLLLDEPLAALDVATRGEMRRMLLEHLDGFVGPRLLITHDPYEAFLVADRIHIIEDGRITQSGTADEIRLHPLTRYAADLAGSNLIVGKARSGVVDVDGHLLRVADEVPDGPVLITIHPTAVAVHMERPGGSPRNTWSTTVDHVESLGTRARLRTSGPLPLIAELTEDARAELGIQRGSAIWVAIKATEMRVRADSGPKEVEASR